MMRERVLWLALAMLFACVAPVGAQDLPPDDMAMTWNGYCSAVMIAPDWILTAAHFGSSYNTFFPGNNYAENNYDTEYLVTGGGYAGIFTNPDYTGDGDYTTDLRLYHVYTTNANYQPVCAGLYLGSDEVGQTVANGNYGDSHRGVLEWQSSTVSAATTDTSTTFISPVSMDIEPGGSGSGLFIQKDGQWDVAGIVWSLGGGATRVSSEIGWIRSYDTLENPNDTQWQGASSDWLSSLNWNNDVPTASAVATVNGTQGAAISTGTAASKSLFVGYGDTAVGQVTQSGGTNSITEYLVLGDPDVHDGSSTPTASGTYQLESGTLSAPVEFIGYGGTGSFVQTGGTNNASSIELGLLNGLSSANLGGTYGTGTYALQNGTVNVSNLVMGTFGTGTFDQYSGTVNANAVEVGKFSAASNKYHMEGGQLNANAIGVGWSAGATGLFEQSGGDVHTTDLAVGRNGTGTYNLSGGSLAVDGTLTVGATGTANGTFNQTAGTASAGTLNVAANSTFKLSGGTFDILSGGKMSGSMDFGSGSGTLNCGGTVDLGNANITGAGETTFSLADHAIAIFPAGFDASQQFGSVINQGLIHEQGSGTLIIPTGREFSGTFNLSDSLTVNGTLTITDGGIAGSNTIVNGTLNVIESPLAFAVFDAQSTITVNGNLFSTFLNDTCNYYPNLVVNSGGYVSGTTMQCRSIIVNGGSVVVNNLFPSQPSELVSGTITGSVASSSSFAQSGGTLTGSIWLNNGGSYVLSAGTLNSSLIRATTGGSFTVSGGIATTADETLVDGTTTQNGGTHTVSDVLAIGLAGYDGTYNLNSGTLTSHQVEIGDEDGPGYFNWNNGTWNASIVDVNNGELNIARSWTYTGALNISGGAVTDTATVLRLNNLSAPAEMTGGSLSANALVVGYNSGTATFEQSGGTSTIGALWLASSNSGAVGNVNLSGGQLSASDVCWGAGTGTISQSGGTLTSDDVIAVDSSNGATYNISGGTLNANNLCVATGTLNIQDPSANIHVSGQLLLDTGSHLSAVSGSTIHLSGNSFEIDSTNSSHLAGLSNLNLVLEHGASEATQIEVAGADVGKSSSGWTNNFVLGKLTLGGSAAGHLELVDNIANQSSGPEALYVEDLVLNAGASFGDALAYNLYYHNGGGAKQFFPGDANLDGTVDDADYTIWANNYSYSPSGKTWAEADFNGDGAVNDADYTIWANNGGSGERNVPEPAAMTLLALGGLGLLRRRS